jgi:hypothetical protein
MRSAEAQVAAEALMELSHPLSQLAQGGGDAVALDRVRARVRRWWKRILNLHTVYFCQLVQMAAVASGRSARG